MNEGQSAPCQADCSGTFAYSHLDEAINVVRHHFSWPSALRPSGTIPSHTPHRTRFSAASMSTVPPWPVTSPRNPIPCVLLAAHERAPILLADSVPRPAVPTPCTHLLALCIDNHPSPVHHGLSSPEIDQDLLIHTCNGCVVSEACHDSPSPNAIMANPMMNPSRGSEV